MAAIIYDMRGKTNSGQYFVLKINANSESEAIAELKRRYPVGGTIESFGESYNPNNPHGKPSGWFKNNIKF